MHHHLSLRHASPSSWSYFSHRVLVGGHVPGQPSSAINLPDQPRPIPSNNSSLTHASLLPRSRHASSTLTPTYPYSCLKSSVELKTCTVASKIPASVGMRHGVGSVIVAFWQAQTVRPLDGLLPATHDRRPTTGDGRPRTDDRWLTTHDQGRPTTPDDDDRRRTHEGPGPPAAQRRQ